MEGIMIFTEEMAYAIMGCIAFMLLDMLTGLIYALHSGTFSSTKLREGFIHKCSLVLILACAIIIEILVMHVPSLHFSVPILVPACVIIIVMEVSSILENIVKINPELANTKLFNLFSEKDE